MKIALFLCLALAIAAADVNNDVNDEHTVDELDLIPDESVSLDDNEEEVTDVELWGLGGLLRGLGKGLGRGIKGGTRKAIDWVKKNKESIKKQAEKKMKDAIKKKMEDKVKEEMKKHLQPGTKATQKPTKVTNPATPKPTPVPTPKPTQAPTPKPTQAKVSTTASEKDKADIKPTTETVATLVPILQNTTKPEVGQPKVFLVFVEEVPIDE